MTQLAFTERSSGRGGARLARMPSNVQPHLLKVLEKCERGDGKKCHSRLISVCMNTAGHVYCVNGNLELSRTDQFCYIGLCTMMKLFLRVFAPNSTLSITSSKLYLAYPRRRIDSLYRFSSDDHRSTGDAAISLAMAGRQHLARNGSDSDLAKLDERG